MSETLPEVDLSELDALDDGYHHLWCKWCHPEWDASPIGPGLGTPFTAWCGVRAVILVRHLSDEIPPNPCPRCAHPVVRCATCGGK